MIKIFVVVMIFLPSVLWAYTPPKGIPNPSAFFGSFGEIDQASPSVATTGNPKCTNWPTAATTDCYYVDKTHPQATNTSNTYGYPNKPRATPPEGTLQAGALVYIHAGTYTEADSGGQNLNWDGVGTASNPIWITGNPTTKPIIQDQIGIGWGQDVSYMVIENLQISGTTAQISMRPETDGKNIDHVIIRNCTITGTANVNDYEALQIGMSSTTDESPNSRISYVVIYNNTVSSIGDKSGIKDQAGIYNSYHTDYVWVLDNLVHDVDADGIAGSHYSNGTTRKSEHYFIGRNNIYANGENCIDVKTSNHVIISENICTGPYSRENGWGIVLHYGANSIPTTDSWVLFNKIYNAGGGIGCTMCQDLHVVGNLIYNMTESGLNDPIDGTGIGFRSTSGVIDIVDNTFYNVAEGIRANESLSSGTTLKIHGNIIANRSDAARYDIRIDGGQEYADLDYNLFYKPSGAAAFYWNGASRNLAYMQGTASECANCVEGDPLFADPPTDFTLGALSPAKGTNVEGPVGATVYAAFEAAWPGLSITPLGGVVDMGATLTEGTEPPPADTTAPTVTGFTPSGNVAYATTKQLSVTTDEAATCRYHATSTTWAEMSEMNSTGGTTHTQTVNVSVGANSFKVVCQDAVPNESSAGTWSFTVAAQAVQRIGWRIAP